MVIPKLPPISQKSNPIMGKRLPPHEGHDKSSIVLISPSAEAVDEHMKKTGRWIEKSTSTIQLISRALFALEDKLRTDEEVITSLAFFLKFIKTEKRKTVQRFLHKVQRKDVSNKDVIASMPELLKATKHYKKHCYSALVKFIKLSKDPWTGIPVPLKASKSKAQDALKVPTLSKTPSQTSQVKSKKKKTSSKQDSMAGAIAIYQKTESQEPGDDKKVEANYKLLRILMEAYADSTYDDTEDSEDREDAILRSRMANMFGFGTEGIYHGTDPFQEMFPERSKKISSRPGIDDLDEKAGESKDGKEDLSTSATSWSSIGTDGSGRKKHSKKKSKGGHLFHLDDSSSDELSDQPDGRKKKRRERPDGTYETDSEEERHRLARASLSHHSKLALSGILNQQPASTAAKNYFSKNNIEEIFSMMLQGLVLDFPEHPLDYLITLVGKIRKDQRTCRFVQKEVNTMSSGEDATRSVKTFWQKAVAKGKVKASCQDLASRI